MEKSGQPAGFYGGNEGGMGFPSNVNMETGCDSMDSFDMSELFRSPQNPTMGTPVNSQQYCGQPARTNHGIGFLDQTNINVQRTSTVDSQQHGQPAGMSRQISFSGQTSSDQTNINVRKRTGRTQKLTAEQAAENKRKIDREYRERKKNEYAEMKRKLKELEEENNDLKRENNDLKRKINELIDDSQSNKKMIDQLKRDVDKLKDKDKKENAFQRKLLKINDLEKFIEEGLQHYKKPTQNPFPSSEERHSEEEFLAGTEYVELDGDDSGDENDDSRKRKKHAARSARSALVGKISRVEVLDDELMETPQVTLAAKKGSTSNHTASWDNDPYSISKCIRILESMEGIPASVAMKAITKFQCSDQRQIFVALKEDWRREWVKNLEKA